VEANNAIIGLNESFIAQIAALDESCGFAEYREKYMKFPAVGIQPDGYFDYNTESACDVWDDVFYAALAVNPCFNIYHIVDTCPIPPGKSNCCCSFSHRMLGEYPLPVVEDFQNLIQLPT
jgi:hypothetical protein